MYSLDWVYLRHFSTFTTGEDNGDPLQYCCLENPMDWRAWYAAVHGVRNIWTWLSDFTFIFHFHALKKELAIHSSVLAWRIPGTGESGGLPSMGSHRVGHDWSDLAAAAATFTIVCRADTSLCTIGDNFWSFLLCTLSGVFFFFQFIYFLLKYNCFTEFSCFMSNLNMNQP